MKRDLVPFHTPETHGVAPTLRALTPSRISSRSVHGSTVDRSTSWGVNRRRSELLTVSERGLFGNPVRVGALRAADRTLHVNLLGRSQRTQARVPYRFQPWGTRTLHAPDLSMLVQLIRPA